MFGRPRCPVDPVTKAWIDDRFLALVALFGVEALQSVRVVQPTREDFPEVFEEERDPAAILRRVAGHLGLDQEELELEVLDEGDAAFTRDRWGQVRGRYAAGPDGPRIRLGEGEAADPQQLVARLVLELSRHELGRENNLGEDPEEGGPCLELYAIIRGLGVIVANGQLPLNSGIRGYFEWWRSPHLGGLDEAAHGYALGLFAWLRAEGKPGWASGLQPEARRHLQAALKYLGKTGDALVQPQGGHRVPADLSDTEMEAWLTTGSPSARINALWAVCASGGASAAVAAAVTMNVGHDDRGVREQALWTIRGTACEEARTVPIILDGLVDSSDGVRVAAIAALAKTCSDAAVYREELLPLLDRQAPPVTQTAAVALGGQEDHDGEIQDALLLGLERSLLAQDGLTTSAFLAALHQNSGDAHRLLGNSPLREDPIHASYLDEGLLALKAGRTLPAEAPQEPG